MFLKSFLQNVEETRGKKTRSHTSHFFLGIFPTSFSMQIYEKTVSILKVDQHFNSYIKQREYISNTYRVGLLTSLSLPCFYGAPECATMLDGKDVKVTKVCHRGRAQRFVVKTTLKFLLCFCSSIFCIDIYTRQPLTFKENHKSN